MLGRGSKFGKKSCNIPTLQLEKSHDPRLAQGALIERGGQRPAAFGQQKRIDMYNSLWRHTFEGFRRGVTTETKSSSATRRTLKRQASIARGREKDSVMSGTKQKGVPPPNNGYRGRRGINHLGREGSSMLKGP